jgi:hypothetical protein
MSHLEESARDRQCLQRPNKGNGIALNERLLIAVAP